MEGAGWRNNIISQLQVRNKRETSSFQDIIAFQSRLFDNVSTLKNENLQLTLVNERIRFSSTESVLNTGGGVSNERIQALEQKILLQQEELTSMHRRRGESSQHIINLNARVHDLEKSLQNKDLIISENAALIASLRAEIQMYETNMTELQGLNQVLRDEHQALQIAFAAIEEKLRKSQVTAKEVILRLHLRQIRGLPEQEAVNNVQHEDWSKIVSKTKWDIMTDWDRDIHIDKIMNSSLIISVTDSDDEFSDNSDVSDSDISLDE